MSWANMTRRILLLALAGYFGATHCVQAVSISIKPVRPESPMVLFEGVTQQAAGTASGPPRCSGERLAVAQRLVNTGSPEYSLQALALCPADFCESVGRRFLAIANPDWDVQVLRLCPNL